VGAPRWPPEDRRGLVWQALSLTSFALSLLMIFRTNSAYARFWEARTAWGLIIALTRNLVRRASAWCAPPQPAAKRRRAPSRPGAQRGPGAGSPWRSGARC